MAIKILSLLHPNVQIKLTDDYCEQLAAMLNDFMNQRKLREDLDSIPAYRPPGEDI